MVLTLENGFQTYSKVSTLASTMTLTFGLNKSRQSRVITSVLIQSVLHLQSHSNAAVLGKQYLVP